MPFLAELKRRKVFQTAAIYAVIAWLVIQIADVLLPAYGAPAWVMPVFSTIVILGFPLAVTLAWLFQTTPEGIQRDAGPRQAEESETMSTYGRNIGSIALIVVSALAVGLVIGGFIGRVTIEAPEIREQLKTAIQLTANPEENPVIGSAISPDGKYLAYIEASGLYLRVIDSGESHQIPLPDGMSFARSEIDWFPDGTHLLLATQVGLEASLWKLAVVGGAPRKLMTNAVSAAISPDGRRIAYFTEAFASNVFLMGPEGENPEELIRHDSLIFREMDWAPNSKFLLIGAMGLVNLLATELQAVNIETRTMHRVMQDARTFQNWRGYLPFCWLPDGRLFFGRREPGSSIKMSNIWQVDIDQSNARMIGEPSQVTRLTGYNARDISVTSDGTRVAFLLEKNQADVYLGDLSPDGRKLSDVRRFTLDERDDYPAGWTPDGSAVYFQSDRAVAAKVFAKNINGGQARAIGTGATQDEDSVQHSPDGKWILYWDQGDILKRSPVDGGPSEQVLKGTPTSDFQCPRSMEMSTDCIVSMREPDNQYVFYAFSPEYGLGRKLIAVEDDPPFANWALSPDGISVALVHNKKVVRIINLQQGSEKEYSEDGWVFGEYVDWSADGKGIYMDGTANNRLFKKSLIYYSPESREASVLRAATSQWHLVPQTSPDGKHLAFALMIFSGNVWMIENP